MARALSDEDITRISKEEGVDARYSLAIAGQENSNDESVSNKNAVGRFQIRPATFKAMLPDGDITNPEDNARAGIRYLKEGLTKTGGDFTKAAGYYYGGPNYDKKVAAAPNTKYDGLSIEGYQAGATNKLTADNSGKEVVPVDTANLYADGLTDQLKGLQTQADVQLANVQKTSENVGAQIQRNIQAQMDTVKQGGELAATVALDKFAQENQRAGENAAVLSKLGINTSDLDSTIAQIATDMQAQFKQAMGLRASIDERRNVSFYDNPLQAIINHFDVQGDIKQHNALVQKIGAEKAYVDNAADVASKIQQVNASKFTSVSLEGAKAAADILRNNATEKSLELQDKLLRNDFDTQVRAFSTIQARIRNIQESLTAESNRNTAQDRDAAIKAKAEAQLRDDQQVKLAGTMLGLTIEDRKTLDKSPKDMKEAVEYIIANGGSIGRDPITAWQVLQRGNADKMPPAVRYQKDILDTTYRAAFDKAKINAQWSTMNAKQRADMLAQKMIEESMAIENNPNMSVRPTFTGVPDNPYHVPPPDVMKNTDARNLRLTKIISDYQEQFKGKAVTDSMVFELAYANVGKDKMYGDITEAARDISLYYQSGAAYNNQKMRFSNFGMPNQTSYNFDKMDLMNYPSLVKKMMEKERMMTRDLSDIYNPDETSLLRSQAGAQ
jgi:hypothetical protein